MQYKLLPAAPLRPRQRTTRLPQRLPLPRCPQQDFSCISPDILGSGWTCEKGRPLQRTRNVLAMLGWSNHGYRPNSRFKCQYGVGRGNIRNRKEASGRLRPNPTIHGARLVIVGHRTLPAVTGLSRAISGRGVPISDSPGRYGLSVIGQRADTYSNRLSQRIERHLEKRVRGRCSGTGFVDRFAPTRPGKGS